MGQVPLDITWLLNMEPEKECQDQISGWDLQKVDICYSFSSPRNKAWAWVKARFIRLNSLPYLVLKHTWRFCPHFFMFSYFWLFLEWHSPVMVFCLSSAKGYKKVLHLNLLNCAVRIYNKITNKILTYLLNIIHI